jgi:putative ABC transport system permease protein
VSELAATRALRGKTLLGPAMLLRLYRRRLRVNRFQELLAGVGVAVAVALLFAVTVADSSVAGSAGEVAHAVIGPANLELRARGGEGFDERLLGRVEHLPGVSQAAALLEQPASVIGPHGRRATVQIAGADLSLALLDGLAHTIPLSAFSTNGIGLSLHTASALGLTSPPARSSGQAAAAGQTHVLLELRGQLSRLPVTAVLDGSTFGALAHAPIAVMPLARLQQLAGLPGRITRILVLSKPGRARLVRSQLTALAGGKLTVAAAAQDTALLHQALRPSDQSSEFFAAICALLGFLFAFNAILLTVPERRRTIADLRLLGMRRGAIAQMVLFQALCLGLVASLVGLLAGYALALGPFHQSPAYLTEAFTLGTNTVVGAGPLLLGLGGGVLATCLASAIPLLDLRGRGALDTTHSAGEEQGDALGRAAQQRLALAAGVVVASASAAFVLWSSLSLAALMVLTLATVLIVPLVLGLVLRIARTLAERRQGLTILPVALISLRGSTVRSLALAATGAVALFGAGALGGARNDLLQGIDGFAHSYTADAGIWVNTPGDYQASSSFQPGDAATRIARVPGVSAVRSVYGGFLDLGQRRVWIIARPAGSAREVLRDQIAGGNAATASADLAAGGQIVLSRQIAAEHDATVGSTLMLPTPTGNVRFRIAATTTNLSWSPGAIFVSAADYRRYWATSSPTALAVELAPGVGPARVRSSIAHALGPASGLEVSTASTRATEIDTLAGAGLSRLGEISTLLSIAAILALATALTSAIWQRRVSLAELRLSGVRPARLRAILLLEATLLLSAGCLTGAVMGIYGQAMIDSYLRDVTGFPLATLTAGLRPLEVLALVIVTVLALVALPGWLAARVSPTLALEE